MPFPYRYCVFDLYGTLVDIRTDEEEPALWEDFSVFLRRYGIVFPAETLRGTYLESCDLETRRRAGALARQGIPGPEEINILCVWERIACRCGVSLSEEVLRGISRWFRQRSTRKLRLFDGARELLEGLRLQGCRPLLLTNAQESFTLPELEALDILPLFDCVYISSCAGVRKPSPAFFGLLFDDGLSPSDCLMVGNDDVCDCHGAARAGMDSLYIVTEQTPPRRTPLPGRCREITSLMEILSLREKISAC